MCVVVIAYIVALYYGRLLPLIFVIVILLGCRISLEYRISLLIWVWHRTDNNCCYSFSLFDLLFCCCYYFHIFFFFILVWNKIVFLNSRTLDQAFVCPSVSSVYPCSRLCLGKHIDNQMFGMIFVCLHKSLSVHLFIYQTVACCTFLLYDAGP